MKVKFLTSLVGLKVNYQTNAVEDIDEKEACNLIDHGIAEAADTNAKKTYAAYKEKEKEKQEQKEEDERRATAILNKHNLEKERSSLQNRVDAITHILDDGEVYYKVYGDLADDLAKSKGIKTEKNVTPSLLEGLNDGNTNDGEKTDLSQGEGK